MELLTCDYSALYTPLYKAEYLNRKLEIPLYEFF